ncbi:hypothetical protein V8J82_15820 [Gymnodinialimonas sp. 2305UL16-5]|uniref:hypothetical protein n=1 Tax=Gymnodinialimonas mytili TaxID=3126503 RepID=UPI0030AB2DDE
MRDPMHLGRGFAKGLRLAIRIATPDHGTKQPEIPMRPLALLCAVLLLATFPVPKSATALTIAELTAIHDTRDEPYRLRSFTIDDEWRADVDADMRMRMPDIADEVMEATSGRFDGATIHLYEQDDTSLISYIVALEHRGEIVLLSWHSTAFFEIPTLVERRIALLDAVAEAYAPDRFAPGWAEATFSAAIQGVQDYHDGVRDGPYPGWAYEDRQGIQTLGQSLIPDWVTITITSLDCAPRYPNEGWAILFLCPY